MNYNGATPRLREQVWLFGKITARSDAEGAFNDLAQFYPHTHVFRTIIYYWFGTRSTNRNKTLVGGYLVQKHGCHVFGTYSKPFSLD